MSVCSRTDARGGPAAHAGLEDNEDGSVFAARTGGRLLGQGMRARAIAGRLYLHEEYVRELIRRFNAGGFAALRPRKASGRPSKYAPEEISVMLEVAGTRPHDLGLPFTVWSLRKLAAHLVRGGVVKELHATTLGRILRDQGFSFQRTKTWKESPDPDFAAKKNASVRSTRPRRRTPA